MRKRFSILPAFALFWGLALVSPFAPAAAQNLPPVALEAIPSDAELDALLAARNWKGLGAALSVPGNAESLTRVMNWLHARIYNGGGIFLDIIYARDLWFVGSSLNIDDPARDMRLSAGLMVLYTYQLVVIDGAECEDQSAPSNRLTQLFRTQAPTLAFLKKQPADLKSKIVDLSIALENRTAPLRKDDDFICRDGMDQTRAGMERGTQQEIPDPSGHYGKTIGVKPPPDWVPKFVSPEIYKPKQNKVRATMRDNLLKLVDSGADGK
jgi:hypothetical protein